MASPKRERMSSRAPTKSHPAWGVRDANFNSNSVDWNIPQLAPGAFSFPTQTASGSGNATISAGIPVVLRAEIPTASDLVSNTMTASFSSGLPFNTVVLDAWLENQADASSLTQTWTIRKASGAAGTLATINADGTGAVALTRATSLKSSGTVPAGTPLYGQLTANSNTAILSTLYVSVMRIA